MNKIHLHGALKDKYGPVFELDVRDAAEALRALITQLPGLEQDFADHQWKLVRGELHNGYALSEDELGLGLGCNPLHIIPVVQGRGGGRGVGKVLMGAAMVAGAFFMAPAAMGFAAGATGTVGGQAMGATAFSFLGTSVTFGNIAAMGAMMALGGVAQMLAPTVKPGSTDEAKKEESFLFSTAVNVSAQGVPVPLVYGLFRTGSVVISSGVEAERIRHNPAGGGGGGGGGGFVDSLTQQLYAQIYNSV
jgi:predicted phage tail protein